MESWNSGLPASKYIVAHYKKCGLCRGHDRLISSGELYPHEKLVVFARHIRKVQASIKQAVEDDEVRQCEKS
ncbi:hypothetical protein LCGC14_1054110 [marine sediment metagenome]|uniref:Uncharacterized protein n=1 Tax=marine sediment metagenome TaxID=412755 RepID=A0A0F9N9T9_9ZZZZ